MPEVLVEVADLVATVRLNRPERRNAISASLLAGLRAALGELDARADVRAIVLTGADPAFCAGLDLDEMGRPGGLLAGATSAHVIPGIAKPLIGAVNGAAVTGGLELALACDFLVASERARFADTHARIGVQPGWGLTVALAEAVGLRRAREMSATGNFVSAHKALEWGLVNHVVPHDDLLDFSRKIAADAASCDPDALQAILATYDEGSQLTAHEARQVEQRTHARWHAGGVDPAEVARRRDDVVERGRAQSRSGI